MKYNIFYNCFQIYIHVTYVYIYDSWFDMYHLFTWYILMNDNLFSPQFDFDKKQLTNCARNAFNKLQ